MGLDVYKLRIVRKYDGVLDYSEIEDAGYHVIIKSEFEEHMLTSENTNLNNLFERFADAIVKIKTQYFDLDYYSEKYGRSVDDIHHIFKEQIEEYITQYGYTELENQYKHLNDDTIIHLLVDADNKIIMHTCNDLKVKPQLLDGLIFRSLGYQRSCELPALYEKFYGDCWYKHNNTGLHAKDRRWFIDSSELDELKECFVDNCDLQNWELYSSEVIYLNP